MKIAKYAGLVLAGFLCEALSGVAVCAASLFLEECFSEIIVNDKNKCIFNS